MTLRNMAWCGHLSVVLSLYYTTVFCQGQEMVPVTSEIGPFSAYYAGCLEFDRKSTEHNGFDFFHRITNNMNIERCIEYCKRESFFYSALYYNETQSATRCACGRSLDYPLKPYGAGSLRCYSNQLSLCDGNRRQVCGAKLINKTSAAASVYKVTNESIVAMLANSREFKLYVNGLLIHEETDWLSKAHFSYIPDPRIDTIHVYAGDSYDGMKGIKINVDKIPLHLDYWKCKSLSSSYSDFVQSYPDWFKTTTVDETWQRPDEQEDTMVASDLAGSLVWVNNADKIVCTINTTCTSSSYFGYNCHQKNPNCFQNSVHPISGYCTDGCELAFNSTPKYGPFCVPNPPGLDLNPRGPCPLCGHCKDALCRGSGEAYYECPRNWVGTKCERCNDGLWGTHCDYLCEGHCRCFQINGTCTACEMGFYGKKCNQPCPDTCRPKVCNRETGTCGDRREIGYYGLQCGLLCPGNFQARACHRDNGNCTDGCESGFYGATCNQRCGNCKNKSCDQKTGMCTSGCINGFFGEKCDKSCKLTCKMCNRWTGSCTNGCKDGYYGPTCDEVCPYECKNRKCSAEACDGCNQGYYGDTCQLACPSGCINYTCNQATGDCDSGCITGLYGRICNMRCPTTCDEKACNQSNGNCDRCRAGFYGEKCDQLCNACVRKTCHQITGKCRCIPGMYGSHCTKLCPTTCASKDCQWNNGTCSNGCRNGFYGNWCEQLCPSACHNNMCNKATGVCDHGCTNGFYGIECDKFCSPTCENRICDRIKGTCDKCQSGYFGPVCEHKCPSACKGTCNQATLNCIGGCKAGFHGKLCSEVCPSTCRNKTCDQTTGNCVKGCKMGFRGLKCDKFCTPHCNKNKCEQKSAKCSQGCITGYHGELCEELCPGSCDGHPCNQSTGECVGKCASGMYGDECLLNCSDSCLNSCNKQSGDCNSCKPGFYGNTCNITCPVGCLAYCSNKNNADAQQNDAEGFEVYGAKGRMRKSSTEGASLESKQSGVEDIGLDINAFYGMVVISFFLTLLILSTVIIFIMLYIRRAQIVEFIVSRYISYFGPKHSSLKEEISSGQTSPDESPTKQSCDTSL